MRKDWNLNKWSSFGGGERTWTERKKRRSSMKKLFFE
jgi:hypothetical protein